MIHGKVIENLVDFTILAKKLYQSTTILHVTSEEILAYKDPKPFKISTIFGKILSITIQAQRQLSHRPLIGVMTSKKKSQSSH